MTQDTSQHLFPYQYELALLNEECGEVVQIVGKTLRFGWNSSSPADPSMTNHDLLHLEVGDILAAVEFAVSRGLLDRARLTERMSYKLGRLSAIAPEPNATSSTRSSS